jgi:hypothetical protein
MHYTSGPGLFAHIPLLSKGMPNRTRTTTSTPTLNHAEPCRSCRLHSKPNRKSDEQRPFQFAIIPAEGRAADQQKCHAPAEHDGAIESAFPRQ